MIDDYEMTIALVKDLEECLPIDATPAKQLIRQLKEQNKKIKLSKKLKILKVIYMGDEGGICCEIDINSANGEVLIVSLTHLILKKSHPMYKRVRTYQLARIKQLAEQNLSQSRM